MTTIKTISGVDCKIGRNSRTGSTISLTVSDQDIIEVVQYFNDFKAGKEPSGKIKKIELNLIYEDDLSSEIELPNTKELDEAITIEDVIIEQDAEHLPANQGDLPLYGKKYDDDGNVIS